MSSKRIAKSMVDWAAFAESVPKNQLPAFRAFKGRSDAFASKMISQSESLPKIDFAAFRSKIALPGLVDTLEKGYSGITVPYPNDKSNMVKSIEEQEINAKSKSAKDIAALQKEIESLKGLLAKIEAIPGPEQMTYQMAAEYFPDQSRDPVNHPTMWPHDADSQIGGSDKHEIK